MKILLIGSGGREHALAWKLSQSKNCEQLFIAPGNAGTALLGTNLPISINDFEALAKASIKNKVDLILVGPEEPLVNGIADFFKANDSTSHIHIIGPPANAAALEGSKAFAKNFMLRHKIPTAAYREFTAENYEEGIEYIKEQPIPVVLKADGLAAGKGVIICQSHVEALAEFDLMIMHAKFGNASDKVVVEAFLTGIEMSFFALTDGENFVILPEAKDYKRINDGDKGLNTGGMGAVSPLPFFDDSLREKVINSILKPTIDGLKEENIDYNGFLFLGLMIENGEPNVIEYNCRLGDPETEVILTRIENDFVELLEATANKGLKNITIQTSDSSAVGIVAVSGGYPKEYNKGIKIEGADATLPNSFLFHAGTTNEGEHIVTNGGRVMVAVSLAENIQEAAELSEYLLQQVYFEDMHYRKDIGNEFITKTNEEAKITNSIE